MQLIWIKSHAEISAGLSDLGLMAYRTLKSAQWRIIVHFFNKFTAVTAITPSESAAVVNNELKSKEIQLKMS